MRVSDTAAFDMAAASGVDICVPTHIRVPGAAKLVEATVGDGAVVDLGSLLSLPGRRRHSMEDLCNDISGDRLPPTFDWAVSIGGAERLRPSCTATFFQALQRSQKGVILSWGLKGNVARNCCGAPSARQERVVNHAMELLNFKVARRIILNTTSASGTIRQLFLAVWEREIPQRELEQHSGRLLRCSNDTTDGAFQVGLGAAWPLSDHYLDLGLARCAAKLSADLTFLDIGGGSGQYGAYFYMQHASSTTPPLVVRDLTRNLVVSSGRVRGQGPSAWMTVDGTPGIEEFTRNHGPNGSAVYHANLCNASLRLPVHDWVMSLEVGEHLPTWCLANYLALLHRSNRRGLILSWSQTTTGTCHINHKGTNQIIAYMEALGGYLPWESTCAKMARHPWLRRTIVFHRRAENDTNCASTTTHTQEELEARS